MWKKRNEKRHVATPTIAAWLAKRVNRLIWDQYLVFRQQRNFKFAGSHKITHFFLLIIVS